MFLSPLSILTGRPGNPVELNYDKLAERNLSRSANIGMANCYSSGNRELEQAAAPLAWQAVKVDCSRLSRQRDDSFCREMAGKGAAAAYPAADFQFCIVMIKHVFNDCQSQPGAAGIA